MRIILGLSKVFKRWKDDFMFDLKEYNSKKKKIFKVKGFDYL